MITIKAFPRIHVSLLDLGNVTPRRYGGGGFSIDATPIEVSAELAVHAEIIGTDLIDSTAREDVDRLLARFRERLGKEAKYRICIRQVPPQHAGFGTKTALLLTLLTALNELTEAGLSTSELQHLTGRGGTSGVGINVFFTGGFVCDLGHPNTAANLFLPSAASVSTEIPSVSCRALIPNGWRFLLLLPRGSRLSGEAERDFFQQVTPVPRIEVLEAIAAMYHAVVPAVLAADILLLRSGLRELHRIGFKRRELDAQSDAVRAVFNRLAASPSLAVGLSSLGPLIYAIADSSDVEAVSIAKDVCSTEGAEFLGAFSGRNAGFELHNE